MLNTAARRQKLVFLAVVLGAGLTGRPEALAAELKPETLKAWKDYERLTEKRILGELDSGQ